MNDDHRILFELPPTAPPTFHPHNLMLELFSHHLIAVLHWSYACMTMTTTNQNIWKCKKVWLV